MIIKYESRKCRLLESSVEWYSTSLIIVHYCTLLYTTDCTDFSASPPTTNNMAAPGDSNVSIWMFMLNILQNKTVADS